MTAGPEFEYLWIDQDKKTFALPASEYFERLMGWINSMFDDESIFPSSPDKPFPKNFKKTIKIILKRLFRIYAHLYHSHLDIVSFFFFFFFFFIFILSFFLSTSFFHCYNVSSNVHTCTHE